MFIVLQVLGLHAQQTRVVLPAQPQVPAETRTGTGAITGTVVDTTTDRPVAGAIVSLEERVAGSRTQSYVQVTTPKGRFAFVDLPASESYFLTATKPGYLDGGYRRNDPRGPSAPLAVKDGQWLADVRVDLARPGSISGTVMDERGEPIVGASVRVLPQVLISGRTQWLAGAVAWTDDRGAYRIPGLGPGRYVVSVPSVQATLPVGATIKSSGAGAGTSMADVRAASAAARAERLVVDAGGGQQLVVGRYTVPPPPAPVPHRALPERRDARGRDARRSSSERGTSRHRLPVATRPHGARVRHAAGPAGGDRQPAASADSGRPRRTWSGQRGRHHRDVG
jgi:hypothetical protein